MKTVRLFAAVAVVLLSQGAARSAFAGSTTGGFHLPLDAGTMNIEFNARSTDSNGSGDGQMTFSAPVELPDVDEDAVGEKGSISNMSMKVDFDCVTINGNQASMSGIVRSSSITGYVGRRVVLAVEDGGEGNKGEPDKFTWGVYDVQHIRWTPSDFEASFDDGWSRTWLATDFERDDDRGVQISRDTETTCRSFPLSAYSMAELPQGSGNIQVRP